ncbi:MAG: TonB-dependent receptor [Thiomicrorhabdus sp.]|nr:TonB-dependent receptor [Thiomicrorhabdus sp.]
MTRKLTPITLAVLSALSTTPVFSEELAPVIVNADLRETTEQDIAASVDIKTQAELQDQGATHFDDVLLKTPNVNFSGQSSRARHIQIRGIGERDEYTGAPNSSVGFAIDDIDFSGIGGAAGLFDVKQVEVLRGPQNTRYGQSAIAGLINIQTNEPTEYRESMVEATVGQDNLKELGVMTSGPISSEKNAPQYRIAIFKHSSDGFRTNETLDRTDTNGRDELTLRGKMRFFPDSDTTIDVSVIHADLNNGYDAWARDNTFTTLSDNPGKDAQLSNAGSIKVTTSHNPNFIFTSKTSIANSDMNYNYDLDWLADAANEDSRYSNAKHRRSITQDLRWSSTENSLILNKSTEWIAGVYLSQLEENNQRFETYNYPSGATIYNTDASSSFNHKKIAFYSQLNQAITNKTNLQYSLRIEHNRQEFNSTTRQFGTGYDYSLSDSFNPNENLWGASIHYIHKYSNTHTAFAGVTRGYKAGGFNAALSNSNNAKFDSETLLNYEIGLKSNYAQYGLKTNTTFFYMDRQNPQFDGYSVEPLGSEVWVFFTENLDKAVNYGLESSFDWQANKKLSLHGALGLIQTDISGKPINSAFTIESREQAHAPNYQASLGAKYRSSNGFFAQADITAVDKFYFDNTHNIESKAYELVNARIGYESNEFELYLWGKNLTDNVYATRAFYFDPNFGTNYQEFDRLGDPRQLGVTARVYF